MKKLFFGFIMIAIVATTFFIIGYINESNLTPYEELCENGYTGTEEELLKTLLEEEQITPNNQQTKTAYDTATENGYKGSKNDWLETLTGNKNNANKYGNGTSVYDMAVDNGYTGSLEEWIESLKEPSDKNSNNKKQEVTNSINTSVTENETSTEQSEFTVVFKNYDGTELKTEIVKNGESATPPATPQRKDYTFVGWDRDFGVVEADMVVNAMFEKITKPTIIVDRVDSSTDEKQVEVNIAVKNNPGIASLNLKVTYASELVLKDVKYNTDLPGQSMKPGKNESPVTLTWVSPFENVMGDWVFATLYFDISKDAKGDLPVCITYDVENIYNIEEENVYFNVIDGAIAITESN